MERKILDPALKVAGLYNGDAVLRCRGAKVLENRITADEERIKQLEKELEMTIVFGEEADRKYEEVSIAKLRMPFAPVCAVHFYSQAQTQIHPPDKKCKFSLSGGALLPSWGALTTQATPPKLSPHFSRHAPVLTAPPGYAYVYSTQRVVWGKLVPCPYES